ncbi:hypothetical protein FLONG3_10815 [Fusarium longipes]|uniref:Uncharacterized protein n=1 Tax=Fusarium longipes TaxID=694270 RepID=A0A395RKH5_9HYPO|nr:hypothetical protein FLONG3_10815 [Fusarium longipes]
MLRYLQLLTHGADATNSGADNHQKTTEESDPTTEQAFSQTHGLEERLTSETHLRRFTETVLDSRQQEIEEREMEKDELALRVEILQKQLASTEQQLAEAQDQVFRLQPSRKDITESEARDAYKTLVGNVQRWVENRAGHVIDDLDTGRLTNRAVPPEGSRLVTLLREQSRRCINVSQSDEFHIMGAIMNYLHITLFSKSFYCPLDDNDDGGTAMWIDELENTMSRLQRAHCREWRSETLTALTHQSAFKSRRQRFINFVVDDLTSLLSVIVPRTPPADLQASVRRSIVEPAADLVHQLHLAASIYSLKWPARSASTRLEVYQCFNLADGGTVLDLSGTKSASPARRNIMYLFDIAPGLFVERIEGGRKLGLKAIAKPTVLVTNAGGDISQGPTVMRWLWEGMPSSQNPSRSASRASNARRSTGSAVSSGRSRY